MALSNTSSVWAVWPDNKVGDLALRKYADMGLVLDELSSCARLPVVGGI